MKRLCGHCKGHRRAGLGDPAAWSDFAGLVPRRLSDYGWLGRARCDGCGYEFAVRHDGTPGVGRYADETPWWRRTFTRFPTSGCTRWWHWGFPDRAEVTLDLELSWLGSTFILRVYPWGMWGTGGYKPNIGHPDLRRCGTWLHWNPWFGIVEPNLIVYTPRFRWYNLMPHLSVGARLHTGDPGRTKCRMWRCGAYLTPWDWLRRNFVRETKYGVASWEFLGLHAGRSVDDDDDE